MANLLLCNITIRQSLWSDCYYEGKFNKKGLNELCDILKDKSGSSCIFCKRSHYAGKNKVSIKFYCRHKTCRAYKLECLLSKQIGDIIVLQLYRSDNDIKHIKPRTRNLTGKKKQNVCARLDMQKPAKVQAQDALKFQSAQLASKDLGDLHSINVYRNIRKEILSKNDEDEDFFTALQLIRLQNEGNPTQYLRYLMRDPLEIIMYSDQQLDTIINYSQAKQQLEACVDITQNIIHNIDGKKVNLIRMASLVSVVEQSSKQIAVYLDVLTTNQSQLVVKISFNRLKQDLIARQRTRGIALKWPLLSSLVVDKDMTLLHGISEGFNSVHLMLYIEKIYEATYLSLTDTIMAKNIVNKFIAVYLCNNHVIKTLADQMSNCSRDCKSFLLKVARLMVNCTNYFHFLNKIWFNLCIVANNEYQNHYVEEATSVLNELFLENDEHEKEHGNLKLIDTPEENMIDKQSTIGLMCNDRQYEQSGFYFDFVAINSLSKEKIDVEMTEKENSLYAPQFIDYFLKFQSPFIPLICPYIKVIQGKQDIRRSSNALIEGSFSHFKTHIREDPNLHLQDRPDRVFEKERTYINAVHNTVLIKKKPKRAKRAVQVPKTAEETDSIKVELEETQFHKRISRPTNAIKALRNAQNIRRTKNIKTKSESIEFYANGLPKDPLYYKTECDQYKHVMVARNEKCYLYADDFLTVLLEQDMISSAVEYCIIDIISKDCQFYAFPESNIIFSPYCRKNKIANLPKPKKSILIFHILFNHHHTLVIADFTKKSLFSLNSLRIDEKEEAEQRFKQFLVFLKAKRISTDEWSFELPEHEYQDNKVDCGVFVIKHTEQYMSTKTFKFDVTTNMRLNLARSILERSQSLIENCIACGNTANYDINKCNVCQRFVHKTCVKKIREYKKQYSDICQQCYKYSKY